MEALRRLQAELRVPKSQWNEFGKYRYRSCEDILEAVKPLLQGSLLTISDEIVMVGQRYYVQATATIRDGDKIEAAKAYAREEEAKKGLDAAQITGAASSYARKYALAGLLLDDTQDADTQDNRGTPEKGKRTGGHQDGPPPPPPPPNPEDGDGRDRGDGRDGGDGGITKKQRAMLFAKMKEQHLNAGQSREFYRFVEPTTRDEASIFIDNFGALFSQWKLSQENQEVPSEKP